MKLHVPVHFNIIDESYFTVYYLGHDKHYANIFQVNDLFSKGNNSSSSHLFYLIKIICKGQGQPNKGNDLWHHKNCTLTEDVYIWLSNYFYRPLVYLGGAFDKRNGETWVWILELYCGKGRWRSKLSSSKFYSLGRVGAWGALVSIIICTILMHVYKRGP